MGSKTWTDENLINIIKDCNCISEILRQLKLKLYAGNYKTIKGAIKRLNLDVSHFKGRLYKGNTPYNKRELKEILVKDSLHNNNSSLKKRLLKKGILKNECEICGQGDE